MPVSFFKSLIKSLQNTGYAGCKKILFVDLIFKLF